MAISGNFLDRVKMNTATTGTGTVTVSTAVSTFQSFASAGAVDATVYWYLIEEGTDWEVGYGTYTSASTSMTRTLVASNTGSLLTLAGAATIAVIAPARSMGFIGARVKKAADQTGANYSAAPIMAFDEEVYDYGGWHDNVTNNSRLTVPAGYGIRLAKFNCTVHKQLGTAGQYSGFTMYKNGVSYLPIQGNIGGNAESILYGSSGWVPVTAGDYFEIAYFSGGDTSITIVAASTAFSVEAC